MSNTSISLVRSNTQSISWLFSYLGQNFLCNSYSSSHFHFFSSSVGHTLPFLFSGQTLNSYLNSFHLYVKHFLYTYKVQTHTSFHHLPSFTSHMVHYLNISTFFRSNSAFRRTQAIIHFWKHDNTAFGNSSSSLHTNIYSRTPLITSIARRDTEMPLLWYLPTNTYSSPPPLLLIRPRLSNRHHHPLAAAYSSSAPNWPWAELVVAAPALARVSCSASALQPGNKETVVVFSR